MSDGNEEQIELILDDDHKVEEPEIIVEKAEEKAPEPDPVDNTLKEMREKFERERQARAEAERRANEAAQEAYRYQAEAQDSNKHLVANAIESVKQTTDILKSNYQNAMATGDFAAAADIQTEIATNAARLMQLEQGRQALETAPKREAPAPYVADPVEALASQLSPRSADWVRRHPEYATDQNLYRKMIAAHNLADADGIAPDSDEYFNSIESTLRIRTSEPEAPVQRRSSPPAAPVSRMSTVPGTSPNRVTLTGAEREIASMMGMTEQEYGKQKLALIREGKMNR